MEERTHISTMGIEPLTTGLSYVIIPLIAVYGIAKGGIIPERLYYPLLAFAVLPHITVIAKQNKGKPFGTLPFPLFSLAFILLSLKAVIELPVASFYYTSLLLALFALFLSYREYIVGLSVLFLIAGIIALNYSFIGGNLLVSVGTSLVYRKAAKMHAPLLAFFVPLTLGLVGGVYVLYMVLIPLYMFAIIYYLGGKKCPFRGEPELAGAGATLSILGSIVMLYSGSLGFLLWGTGLLVLVSGVLSPSWFTMNSVKRDS